MEQKFIIKRITILCITLLWGLSACLPKGSGIAQGDVDYSQPEAWYARFVVQDRTVKDTKTGDLWVKSPKSGLDWYAAVEYCKNLDLEGQKWKLPSKRQLENLLSKDHPVRKGCWLNPAFDGCGIFWASNEVKDAACTPEQVKEGTKECKLGGFVDAGYGGNGFDKKNERHQVRCVVSGK